VRQTVDWWRYYLDIAEAVAKKSKDPSTQVGCILVSPDNHIISTGYNGMPPGLQEDAELWERPTKYGYVIHAEQNAVARAAMHGVATLGATAYVTHFPCSSCARTLVAAGVKKIVAAETPLKGEWDEEHDRARKIIEGAGASWTHA
jgi:dCMP deaminase